MKTRGPPCGAATFSHWGIPVAAELEDVMTKNSVKSFDRRSRDSNPSTLATRPPRRGLSPWMKCGEACIAFVHRRRIGEPRALLPSFTGMIIYVSGSGGVAVCVAQLYSSTTTKEPSRTAAAVLDASCVAAARHALYGRVAQLRLESSRLTEVRARWLSNGAAERWTPPRRLLFLSSRSDVTRVVHAGTPRPSGRAAGCSLKALRPGCRKSGDRRFRREAADTGPLENCTLSTVSLGPCRWAARVVVTFGSGTISG
ncbi:hypothetical protein HPB51_024863 [Rhipicephalus microplus]|uniref:Uncharacterized protein n=1 Tax=Rhipicephalus microplus TaxID=6941 RepID=A0A9J6F8Y6_RHIMP|nr:hypothetical protein HPB51_024863 [Rhipicephalus microplus]